MFEGSSFGRTIDILQRTMDVNMLRQDVIANNIANSDTPHFKRSFVNFEASLRRALADEQRDPGLRAKVSRERHIAFYRPQDYRDVQPRRVLDYTTTAKNNGNNVDIEVESMNLVNNQLAYNLHTANVNAQFARVNSVLR
jgi:flagellar basal-body rod protein FlgB